MLCRIGSHASSLLGFAATSGEYVMEGYKTLTTSLTAFPDHLEQMNPGGRKVLPA